ncbi:MAG: hypothetical protein LBK42_04090 [Propionibacteriaceae bacterium]|nr:hypothetical protein [Propionibacteriaceae bacterium]
MGKPVTWPGLAVGLLIAVGLSALSPLTSNALFWAGLGLAGGLIFRAAVNGVGRSRP